MSPALRKGNGGLKVLADQRAAGPPVHISKIPRSGARRPVAQERRQEGKRSLGVIGSFGLFQLQLVGKGL